MKKPLQAMILFLFVVMVFVLTSCSSQSKQGGSAPAQGVKTLKIGVLANETGWFSTIDLPCVYELKSYVNVLNDQGGVKIGDTTYKIELVVQDGKSDNAGIRAAAMALVDAGCKFVIETNDFWVVGAEDIFEKAGVMHLNNYCVGVPGFISPKNPHAFTGTNGAIGDYTTCFKILNKYYPNVKTAVLACDDNGNVPQMNKQLQTIGARYGIKVLDNYVIFPGGTVDTTAIATKLKASGADAFMTFGSVTTIGGVLKELRHMGSNMVMAAIVGQNCEAILKVAGADAANNGFNMGLVLTDPNLNPIVKAVVDREVKDYGPGIVDSYNGYGVDNLYELLYVMQQCKSTDVETVEKEWESLTTIETPNGPAKVTGMQTYGVKHAVELPTPVSLLQDGKVVMGGWMLPDIP